MWHPPDGPKMGVAHAVPAPVTAALFCYRHFTHPTGQQAQAHAWGPPPALRPRCKALMAQ